MRRNGDPALPIFIPLSMSSFLRSSYNFFPPTNEDDRFEFVQLKLRPVDHTLRLLTACFYADRMPDG